MGGHAGRVIWGLEIGHLGPRLLLIHSVTWTCHFSFSGPQAPKSHKSELSKILIDINIGP